MTFGHIFFIPMVALTGILIGFIFGARAARNAADAVDIAAPGSRVALLVVPADEEGVIAAATRSLVPAGGQG